MKKVLVSRDDAWKLESSMFVIDGSWETGYTTNDEVLFMVGVTTYCEVGESSPWEDQGPLYAYATSVASELEHSESFWLRQAGSWASSAAGHLYYCKGDYTRAHEMCAHILRCLANHHNAE